MADVICTMSQSMTLQHNVVHLKVNAKIFPHQVHKVVKKIN